METRVLDYERRAGKRRRRESPEVARGTPSSGGATRRVRAGVGNSGRRSRGDGERVAQRMCAVLSGEHLKSLRKPLPIAEFDVLRSVLPRPILACSILSGRSEAGEAVAF